jgi:hypothetical protein
MVAFFATCKRAIRENEEATLPTENTQITNTEKGTSVEIVYEGHVVYLDMQGIVRSEFLSPCQTVNLTLRNPAFDGGNMTEKTREMNECLGSSPRQPTPRRLSFHQFLTSKNITRRTHPTCNRGTSGCSLHLKTR